MRILTYLCALLLVGGSVLAYHDPARLGLGPQEWTILAPAAAGLGMLIGALLSYPFRRFGIHLAMLAAFLGVALAAGRLAPAYAKEMLDWQEPMARFVTAIAAVCALYWLFGLIWMCIPDRKTR